MAQTEATADPSMEEILASIRKIIAEDGDSNRPGPPHLAVVGDSEDDETGDAHPIEGSEIGTPDLDEEPAGEEIEAASPLDLERDMAELDQIEAALAEEDGEESGDMVSERDDQHAEYEDAPDAEPESEPIWHAPDYDTATATEEADAADQAPGPKAKQRSGEIDPRRLLSPRSDEAVQSAFNQLADIILSEQTRTLEDLVKDMMQPLLRHWLDDNLPVLVERLVREEIERVSRGRR